MVDLQIHWIGWRENLQETMVFTIKFYDKLENNNNSYGYSMLLP
jgi:hypothetical protein